MITITGIPFYDGIIEGLMFIPLWFLDFLRSIDNGGQLGYNMGFWIGIIMFITVLLRLFWHGD